LHGSRDTGSIGGGGGSGRASCEIEDVEYMFLRWEDEGAGGKGAGGEYGCGCGIRSGLVVRIGGRATLSMMASMSRVCTVRSSSHTFANTRGHQLHSRASV